MVDDKYMYDLKKTFIHKSLVVICMLEKEIWSSCFYKKKLRGLHENISDILTMELVLRQNCNLFWVSNHIFLQVRREWLFQRPCGNCFLNFWPKDTDQVHIHLLEFSGTLKWNTDKNKSRINNSTTYHIMSQIQNPQYKIL